MRGKKAKHIRRMIRYAVSDDDKSVAFRRVYKHYKRLVKARDQGRSIL